MVDDTNKMLRAIINGQSAMKSELLAKIDGVHKEVKLLKEETKSGFKGVNKRMDVIGLHLENVDEDAPTVEEFDKLVVRVKKVEVKVASI